MAPPANRFGGPLTPEGMEYLGLDAHGFRYYDGRDGYVYQQYPERPYWDRGCDRRGEMNGWICSRDVWATTFHKLLVADG